MIIEAVTVVTVVETGREILEILHLLHVGHMTGQASYKKGDAVIQSLAEKYQNWLDQKRPDRQLMREASTLYDFDASSNDQEKVKDEAEKYLTKLKDSVKASKKAQKYFLRLNTTLIQLVSALKSNNNIQCEVLLSELRANLNSFKDKLEDFLDLIEPPPRGILYLADLLQKKDKEGVIKRFNKDLKKITNYIELLDEKKQHIANRIKEGFEAIHTSLPSTSSSTAQPFEQSPQNIEEYIDFLKTEQANPLEANPNWFPLLTADEQIAAGQRIFLHAMDEPKNNEDEKLLIAQIFLRKPVPQQVMKQNDVNMQAYEIAGILLEWQIKKCGELIDFLKNLKQGERLPNYDRDGLREWLETKKANQNSIALFKEILVLPCCLSECSPESAHEKLDKLLLDENPHELIQKHQDSHWGAIWEKNDSLIQLPPSFQTNILPRHRKQDCQLEDSNIVSSVMQELATKLITDLECLKTALEKNIRPYSEEFGRALLEKTKASDIQKNDEHAVGVARIKDAARRTIIISSPRSSLFPYLYQANTINEEDKKRQVPTLDDLSQIIYIGLDPKGVCKWKAISPTSSQTNQLSHYFYPDKKNDSRKKAWLYAYIGCQLNIAPLLSHLFSNIDRPLPLTNTPESDAAIKNELSIQAIVEDPNKVLSLTDSKALSGLTPKTVEETQTVYQEFQDYHKLALVRMNPEYRNKLSFKQQLECLFKNFFKFSKKVGEERLLTVQIIIGDFSTVLSAEQITDIKAALETLKENCKNRREEAKPNSRSSLYKLINKLLNGPAEKITNQLNGHLEKTTTDSELTAQQTVAAAVDVAQKKIEEANKKTEDERKEKEAAQAREEQERNEKEAAQAEVERLNALLAALQPAVVEEPQAQPQPAVAEEPQVQPQPAAAEEPQAQSQSTAAKESIQRGVSETNSTHEEPELIEAKAQVNEQRSLAGSRETLFHHVPTTPQASNTAAENVNLPGRSHGS